MKLEIALSEGLTWESCVILRNLRVTNICSDEEKLVRHSVQSYESVLSADDEERGREYTQLSKRRGTMAPLVTLPEDLEDENNQNDYNSKFFHDKDQDWQNVDMVAWILLLCITIECFIEGSDTSVATYKGQKLHFLMNF